MVVTDIPSSTRRSTFSNITGDTSPDIAKIRSVIPSEWIMVKRSLLFPSTGNPSIVSPVLEGSSSTNPTRIKGGGFKPLTIVAIIDPDLPAPTIKVLRKKRGAVNTFIYRKRQTKVKRVEENRNTATPRRGREPGEEIKKKTRYRPSPAINAIPMPLMISINLPALRVSYNSARSSIHTKGER
jgi:hypothetical protein